MLDDGATEGARGSGHFPYRNLSGKQDRGVKIAVLDCNLHPFFILVPDVFSC